MEAKEGGTFPRESTVKSDIFALGRADFNAGVDLMQREVSSTGCLRRFFPSPGAWNSFPSFGQVQHQLLDFPPDLQTFRGREKGFNHSCSFCLLKQLCAPRDADLTKVASILIMPYSPQARSACLGIFSLQRLQLLLLPKFSPSSSSMDSENSPSGVSMINFPFEILSFLTESRSTENFSTIIFLAVSGLIEPPQFSPKMSMFSSLTSPRFASS